MDDNVCSGLGNVGWLCKGVLGGRLGTHRHEGGPFEPGGHRLSSDALPPCGEEEQELSLLPVSEDWPSGE